MEKVFTFKFFCLLGLCIVFTTFKAGKVQAQSLVGTWIWNMNNASSDAYGNVHYNDTYIFFDDNTGSWETRGFRNGNLFVVRRQQFTWKRNGNKVVFYITEAIRYDVSSGNTEKDTKSMYSTQTTQFKFEGRNILFLGEPNDWARYVRQ